MLAAGHLSAAEARADLEALGGGDGQHSVRELRLELVEHWFAQARGHTTDDARHGATDGILRLFGADDALEVKTSAAIPTHVGENGTFVMRSAVSG